MLFHASIPADEPERVARVIAELWRGRAYPFPPYPGAYVACAGDDRGTLIDVVPRALEHVPAPGCFAVRTNAAAPEHSPAHLAIGTRIGADEIFALAAREGWLAQRSDRGGLFGVVELWIENKFLLELLPEEEQRRYTEMLGPARVDASLGNLPR
ncbi:MAG TPA: hypothetical protein VF322_09550 [Gammaproteobacteria bacterium]